MGKYSTGINNQPVFETCHLSLEILKNFVLYFYMKIYFKKVFTNLLAQQYEFSSYTHPLCQSWVVVHWVK